MATLDEGASRSILPCSPEHEARGEGSTPNAEDEREALRAEVARLRAAQVDLELRTARAEEELRAAHAIHTALIESLPFDFWARDRDGYCFSQNGTTRANWGNLVGKRPEDTDVAPTVIEAWLANNRRALAGETVSEETDYEIHGETRHIHNVLAPIRMGDAIIGTLGVNVDITEIKRADTERTRALEALLESEGKLRLAVGAAGIGLFTWDVHADMLTWNDTLCAIWGVAADRAPKSRAGFLELVHPDDRARLDERIDTRRDDDSWEGEYRAIRGDGTIRWVMSHRKLFRVRGREVVVGTVLDVTERRERDERRRQAQKLEAIGQLTAGIAHNFNNMLMGILPNLELAQEQAPAAIVPRLKIAEQSAQRAADLVRQLTTFAGRNRRSVPQVQTIASIVERSVALCRTTFDRRIALVTTLHDAARVRGDAGQLQQAIMNLLINARDAFEGAENDAPCVSVDVRVVRAGAAELEGRDDDRVRVRISDNGVGMDAATLAHLYEPFFTTKAPGKGTGLGLATTHAIVREHGGFITCTSTPGVGTTFSLYLPVELAPADTVPPKSLVSPARGTETVLLVDDEPAIRNAVSAILGDAGFDSMAVGSGEEALELLTDAHLAAKVRLVLLDVSMPGMPSNVLRARLREIIPEARIVYFTGYAFETSDTEDTVLEKPVTRERLLSTVREVLDQPRNARRWL